MGEKLFQTYVVPGLTRGIQGETPETVYKENSEIKLIKLEDFFGVLGVSMPGPEEMKIVREIENVENVGRWCTKDQVNLLLTAKGTGVVVIDHQYDFLFPTGRLGVPGPDWQNRPALSANDVYQRHVEAAVKEIRAWKSERGLQLHWSQDWHPPGHSSFASTYADFKNGQWQWKPTVATHLHNIVTGIQLFPTAEDKARANALLRIEPLTTTQAEWGDFVVYLLLSFFLYGVWCPELIVASITCIGEYEGCGGCRDWTSMKRSC